MSNGTHRRVVVTGLGVVAPNGLEIPEFWRTIVEGESAARTITRFDPSPYPNRIACEIPEIPPPPHFDPKTLRRLDRSLRYGLFAAEKAVRHAQIDLTKLDPDRLGVAEGTSVSNNEMAFKSEASHAQRGYKGLSPYTLINGYCGSGSGEIAAALGIQGHVITICSGSASSNDSIGYAYRMIASDETDVMIAGGAEAPLLPPLWGAFCLTKVVTARNSQPAQAMRPFDRTRDGFLLGEGAGYLVLEELSHALARNAAIYAELIGHGRSCEAYHPVSLHPEGIGVIRAMEKALREARIESRQIDYINAHGTATGINDAIETLAIKRLFGAQAARLAISSTKPVTGHLLGAAGALETIVCALALHHQVIPPTLNLHEPDADCDLDYVPNRARPYPLRYAMNLNSGFGGKNSCLLLAAYPPRP